MSNKIDLERLISHETLLEFLDYDPLTGILTWKKRSSEHFNSLRAWRSWNTQHSGKRADYKKIVIRRQKSKPYPTRNVSIFSKQLRAHRVIWYWMTGSAPPDEIDHIDRNSLNNVWSNLRCVTRVENSNNVGVNRRNTSGVRGVGIHSCGKWRARLMILYKEKHLGLFDTKEEAEQAVIEARIKYGIQG